MNMHIFMQTFSIINIIKNKYRSTLTDSHLKLLILSASTKISPDICHSKKYSDKKILLKNA